MSNEEQTDPTENLRGLFGMSGDGHSSEWFFPLLLSTVVNLQFTSTKTFMTVNRADSLSRLRRPTRTVSHSPVRLRRLSSGGFDHGHPFTTARTHHPTQKIIKWILIAFVFGMLAGRVSLAGRMLLSNTPALEAPTCFHAPLNYTTPCLPRFLIGGAMKCGTNEVMRLISKHPRVKFNLCPKIDDGIPCDQIHYQGTETDKLYLWESEPTQLFEGWAGIRQFFERFPDTDGINSINVDKSPQFLETFHHPDFPKTVRDMMPGTKMVFVLCDPALRLASEYYHHFRNQQIKEQFVDMFQQQKLKVPASFADFVALLGGTSHHCQGNEDACRGLKNHFLPKGVYVRGITDWLEHFAPSDLLILDMEASPKQNAEKLIKFAGLPLHEYPWGSEEGPKEYSNPTYSGRQKAWVEFPEAMKTLAKHYAPYNHELAAKLQVEFPLRWRSTRAVDENAFDEK